MGARDQQYIKEDNVKRIAGIFDEENKKHQAGSIYDSNGILWEISLNDKVKISRLILKANIFEL